MTSAQSDALNAAEREAATSSTGPPDWSTCELELECARCGYNLRGLTGSRCPECGLELNWPAIVKATVNLEHVPLFEYQWRTRPVRALFGSLVMSVTPWRTWKLIPLTAKPRVGLLIAQIVLATAVAIPLTKLVEFVSIVLLRASGGSLRNMNWYGLFYVFEDWLDWRPLAHHLLLGSTICLFMYVFHRTLVRHGIRYGHIFRISVFIVLLLNVRQILRPAMSIIELNLKFRMSAIPIDSILPPVRDFVFLSLITWTLARAFRDYLHLERAGLIAIATVVLTALTWTTITILWSIYVGSWWNELAMLFGYQWSGFDRLVDRIFGL